MNNFTGALRLWAMRHNVFDSQMAEKIQVGCERLLGSKNI
jgi:hypothetical protein